MQTRVCLKHHAILFDQTGANSVNPLPLPVFTQIASNTGSSVLASSVFSCLSFFLFRVSRDFSNIGKFPLGFLKPNKRIIYLKLILINLEI